MYQNQHEKITQKQTEQAQKTSRKSFFTRVKMSKTASYLLRVLSIKKGLKIREKFVFPNQNDIRLSLKGRTSLLVALLVLAVLVPAAYFLTLKPHSAGAWFNDNWMYRKSIPVTNNTSVESNVYIAVTLDTSDTTRFQADGGDLRFTKYNGQLLPYYISSGVGTTATIVHVNFDSLPAGLQTVYYYYGNPGADNGFSATGFSPEASDYSIGSLGSEEESEGPVAYWSFDEGYGTTAHDSTQNGNDGTFGTGSSAPSWQTEDMCISGKCLKFDGADDYVKINQASSINSLTEFSFSFWIKHDGTNIDNYVLYKGSVAPSFTVNIHYNTIKQEYWTSGGTRKVATTINTVSPNNWHLVTFTFKANDSAQAYLDGQLIQNTDIPGDDIRTNSEDLYVNTFNGTTGSYNVKGFFDDFKIYPYARSAEQIKTDFNAGLASGASAVLGANTIGDTLSNGLVGYWAFDTGSGSTAADSSGNNNTGTFGTGTSAPGWTTGMYGVGLSFDSNDYLSIGGTSSGIQTISFWAHPGSTATSFLDLNGSAYVTASAGTILATGVTAPVYYVNGATSSTITTGTWQHITITTSSGITGSAIKIGTANSAFYNGLIDEVRIYNRALSPKEVRDLYAWAPGPVGYWKFDENNGTNIYDSSGRNVGGTWTGNANHWKNGKFGGAGNFTPDNDFVTLTNSGDMSIYDGSDFTYMAWVKSNSIPGGDSEIQGIISDHYHPTPCYGTSLIIGGSNFKIAAGDGQDNRPLHTFGDTLEANRWYHVAAVYKNGTFHLYTDGVKASETWATTVAQNSSDYVIGRWAPSYGGWYEFDGLIDEVKIYNYARTQKQIISDMNADHPAVGSPVGSPIAHWDFDEGYGTTVNNIGNGGSAYNGTFGTGTSAPSWTNDGKFGKALEFSGTVGAVITAPSIPNITISGTYSFSAWIKPSASGTIFQQSLTLSDRHGMVVSNDGGLTYGYYNGSAWTGASGSVNMNEWNHVVGTNNNGTLRLYINGILQTGTSVPYVAGGNNMYLGRRTTNPDDFDGLMDEIKVYSYTLTEDEVKLDYNFGKAMVLGANSTGTGNTAPDSASSQAYCIPGDTSTCSPPVAEWNFEEGTGTSAYDTSGNSNTGVITGATRTNGKVGNALKFDGNNDYVLTENSAINYTNGLTFTAWIYPSNTTGNHDLISHRDTVNTAITGNSLFRIDDGKLVFGLYDGAWIYAQPNLPININEWQFVSIVYDGATAIFTVNNQTETESFDYLLPNINEPFIIGIHGALSAYPFNGLIDQVRIYNYARTAAQIAWDYNRGGPVGHWDLDECEGTTVHDMSGNGYTGNISIGSSGSQTTAGSCGVGNTAAAWYNGASGKYNASLNFDGTDDYVGITHNLGNNIKTVSTWFKLNSLPSGTPGGIVLTNANSASGPTGFDKLLRVTTTGKIEYYFNDGSGRNATGTTTLTTGTWYHAVGVTSGSETIVYLNGVKEGSYASTSTYSGNYMIINFNDSAYGIFAQDISGQTDDVRIYNYALTAEQVKQLYNQNSAVRFGE